MDAVIELANTLLSRSFWKEGRSLENLGLAGLKPEEIRALVME
jgi:hypothetical protein